MVLGRGVVRGDSGLGDALAADADPAPADARLAGDGALSDGPPPMADLAMPVDGPRCGDAAHPVSDDADLGVETDAGVLADAGAIRDAQPPACPPAPDASVGDAQP